MATNSKKEQLEKLFLPEVPRFLSNLEAFRLFKNEGSSLILSEQLDNIYELRNILNHLDIKFVTQKNTFHGDPNDNMSLYFGLNTSFINLYLLVMLLQEFGLKTVTFSRLDNSKFYCGISPLEIVNVESMEKIVFSGFSCETILKLPIGYNTEALIYDFIEHDILLEPLDDDPYTIEEPWIFSSADNHEEDTFNALTDGQLGDYDSWKENGGNLDDLKDHLGL
ncbi:hypothetical protein GYB22_11885 [bacterium]|nr:hypothetical protein [bacterium]